MRRAAETYRLPSPSSSAHTPLPSIRTGTGCTWLTPCCSVVFLQQRLGMHTIYPWPITHIEHAPSINAFYLLVFSPARLYAGIHRYLTSSLPCMSSLLSWERDAVAAMSANATTADTMAAIRRPPEGGEATLGATLCIDLFWGVFWKEVLFRNSG